MANSGFSIGYIAPPAVQRFALGAVGLAVLLLLIFVGLGAFQPPPTTGAAAGASQGDWARQASYIAAFLVIVIAALQHRGLGAVHAVPAGLAVLLCWCLASAFWSAEPGVVLRRAGLEVILVTSLCFSVDTLGSERAFRIWRWVLAAALVINFLSIPLIPAARHLAGEGGDAGLVGAWRGLYGHKNIAGAVCAITAILFLFARIGWRNWIGIAVTIAACVFLVMTRSKTSLGLLPLALAAGLIYRAGWRDGLSRAVLVTGAVLLLVGGVLFAVLDGDILRRLLEDPQEFTGRAAIWGAELGYIRDHPLLGSGFGTFAGSGGLSPLHNYAGGAWVESAAHGHDGYLQLLVTIGGIGFALAMLALVAGPLGHFWSLDWDEDGFKPMLFALFIFLVLHNVMESDFLEGDSVTWAALVLVIAALSNRGHKSLTGSF